MTLEKLSTQPELTEVKGEHDIVIARATAKAFAEVLGFGYMDQTRIATAVSELARNALQFGGGGTVKICQASRNGKKGIEVVVEDKGPGIQNLELALKGGHSTGGGLGLGLSGSRKLMDEFNVETAPDKGTKVTVRKWL
jgi:serine/threonine-protein kinase RsbT